MQPTSPYKCIKSTSAHGAILTENWTGRQKTLYDNGCKKDPRETGEEGKRRGKD